MSNNGAKGENLWPLYSHLDITPVFNVATDVFSSMCKVLCKPSFHLPTHPASILLLLGQEATPIIDILGLKRNKDLKKRRRRI